MNRDSAKRLVRAAFLAALLAIPLTPAHALEALDGRVQAHGFFESQLRVISDDFSGDYDLAQWYQVLNVELEIDILPDGYGYIDLLQAYVRIEGRYDCAYSRGCGMIQGADAYGDKAKNLPRRVASGRQSTFVGAIPMDSIETRTNEFVDTDGDGLEDQTRQTIETTVNGSRIADNRHPLLLRDVPGFSGLGAQPGADGYTGTAPFGNAANGLAVPPEPSKAVSAFEVNGVVTPGILNAADGGPGDPGGDWALKDDDPFDFVFGRFSEFKFAHRGLRGGGTGGMPVAVMGPWLPKNFIEPNALLADIDNPFDATATPELLERAAYNGSFYADVGLYGLNFRSGDIDPDARLTPDGLNPTYLESDVLIDSRTPNGVGGVTFRNVVNAAEITSVDTSEVFTPLARFTPAGQFVVTPQPVGLVYLPPPPTGLRLFVPRLGGVPVAGIGASVSPNRRGTAKPMRPVPIVDAGRYAEGDSVARGVYLPSRGLRSTIDTGRLDRHPLNIDEQDRTWNRGASQDEGELKEAYIDLETWDSRLWLRIGKQNIVWGKTELFRTTDQFNPVDLALVTLGNLEETRIALWSARAVLSLYEIGPFDDVRLEFAANIDDYESNDLGGCGEPFAPNPVCAASFGMFAHGAFGVGLAGVDFPDSPWEDFKKIEFGGRLEWRWDRFSFALADFYGYEDLPFIDRISTYQRNVDPNTGRMRAMSAFGPCTTQPLAARTLAAGPLMLDSSCLQAGPTRRDDKDAQIEGGVGLNTYLADPNALDPNGVPVFDDPAIIEFDPVGNPGVLADPTDPTKPTYSPNNALDAHPVNQQFFTAICAGTVGISALDPAACAGTIFGSQQALPINANLFRLSSLIGNVLTGSGRADGYGPVGLGTALIGDAVKSGLGNTFDFALVKLNRDLGDAEQGGSDPWGGFRFDEAGLIDYQTNNFGCVDNSLLENSQLTRSQFTNINNRLFSVDDPIPCHSSGSITDNLGLYLTPEQQALLGCGPFFGTNCADSGIDLLNAEASVLFQSFPGFEGTANAAGGPNFSNPMAMPGPRQWTTTNTKHDGTVTGRRLDADGQDRQQPGTLFFQGGPVGTVVVDPITGEQQVLPGARSAFVYNAGSGMLSVNPLYDPAQDGCVGDSNFYAGLNNMAGLPFPAACAGSGSTNVPLHALEHPLADRGTAPQYFRSEMAALSYNFLMLLAINDSLFDEDNPFAICEEDPNNAGMCLMVDGAPKNVCSFATPQHCGTVRGLLGLAGLTRNTLRAGGDGSFGRRTFVWQSGGEAVLGFARRNVLGISGDFAEDVTKSSWSLEATWIPGVPRARNDTYSGVMPADDYNVTLSIDRPTFVNFLNANRTFFFNMQWFFQYRDYRHAKGVKNLLGTFTILAGYFQDRLLPEVTFVYDIRSRTGAVLPQIQYRYTESFSIVVGAQFFAGNPEVTPMSINGLGPVSNEQGRYAYQVEEDRGLSIVRALDNFYVRLRYSF
jgi:hypothetical protein